MTNCRETRKSSRTVHLMSRGTKETVLVRIFRFSSALHTGRACGGLTSSAAWFHYVLGFAATPSQSRDLDSVHTPLVSMRKYHAIYRNEPWNTLTALVLGESGDDYHCPHSIWVVNLLQSPAPDAPSIVSPIHENPAPVVFGVTSDFFCGLL